MSEWRSDVLRCNICDEGCAVCEFLNGNRDTETLLGVIKILDRKLADSQYVVHVKTVAMHGMHETREDLLAACKAAVDVHKTARTGWLHYEPVIQQIESAIAKATGAEG